MKRVFALLLVLSFLLAGCSSGSTKKEHAIKSNSKVSQEKMPEQELTQLGQSAEFALMAAIFRKWEFASQAKGFSTAERPAYLGDLDGDGQPELVYGFDALTLDLSDGYHANLSWEQSGNNYYLDKDGNVYATGSIGGSYPEGGTWYELYNKWYKQWNGTEWETKMSFDREDLYYYKNEVVADNPYSTKFTGKVNGKDVTEDQWDDHIERIALTEIQSNIQEFTSLTVDKKYRNAVKEELFNYLANNYDCSETISFDADGDGEAESYIAVHNPQKVWEQALNEQEFYRSENEWLGYDFGSDYTVLFVSDPSKNQITLSAHCLSGYVSISEDSISYTDGMLALDGEILSLPKDYSSIDALNDTQKENVYLYLKSFLEGMGYDCYSFKWTALGEGGGQELLCICENYDGWYALLFTLKDGELIPVWQQELSDCAYYLVEDGGSQHLLSYYQWVSTTGGDLYTRYSYSLFNFDADYGYNEKEYESISYTNNDQDATYISQFFSKFNRYLKNAVVIGDEYAVSGQTWMDQDDADYGTVPSSNKEGKLGYVQIEDPASFLNLREGPGTNYDVVLLDPYNKDSFVKQALGSPVTILDEIHTGNKDNPVWVKIRIHYGDREVVGYSSKRFIREAE